MSGKNRVLNRILLFFITLILLLAFNIFYKRLVSENKELQPTIGQEKYESLKNTLVGKKLEYFSQITGMVRSGNKYILFLYMGVDCGNCINNGFEIIREADSLLTSQNFNVFAENSNISKDHEIFKYHYYIYDDFKGKIRHALGYIYTPAFIILDFEYKI